jgi:putative FmdB family regulatory protein
MPLYEYQCDTCGTRFERIQKFSDPPVAVCPTCSGPVRKLLSSPAIQFKGSGWYVTDYARAGSSDATKTDAKAEVKADAPADTKPAESAAKSDSRAQVKTDSSPKTDAAKPTKSAD